jgi:hypothetical protein
MNFVDVQPDSFLDYAFTSPTPNLMATTKSSKTGRKQNRCCDQCRKGKRACDAAILEDALLEETKRGESPTTFHYSGKAPALQKSRRETDGTDNYGPLASCSNCERTKKTCTFEWLRSQRVLQARESSVNPAPPSKRRRTSSTKTSGQSGDIRQTIVEPIPHQITTANESLVESYDPSDLGASFTDFASGLRKIFNPFARTLFQPMSFVSTALATEECVPYLNEAREEEDFPLDGDSGKGSSLDALSDNDEMGGHCRKASSKSSQSRSPNLGSSAIVRKYRKRRLSDSTTSGATPHPAVSFGHSLVSSTSNAFLTDGLLRIYHNSFENALSCWVTERTCPYKTKAAISKVDEARPDWNSVYHHVFRLDRLAANIRGRQLTFTEDQAAAKALNLTIYAFATQWAQSSQRSNARYPFGGAESDTDTFGSDSAVSSEPAFDRSLQINAWHEAHNALHAVSEIESFRVVLAQMVFALTQKPVEGSGLERKASACQPEEKQSEVDQGLNECDDLLSKLNLAIDADGPPTHMEQGLRLIHSLRSRMAMMNVKPHQRQYRASTSRLEEADRAAVDLLFWLGVMFDTLSAAMNKRPLVVSDEDSDIYPSAPEYMTVDSEELVASATRSEGLWDGYLFARQDSRLQVSPVRWPCSFDEAAALLCDAAPAKVLLFRKVTRIQTLVTRNARGPKIETSLQAALDVHAHWTKLYAPFIRDCIQHHDQLHPRIQSWYTCLAGHWFLAVLLLADLIEIVDVSEIGVESLRARRASTGFVASFRKANCQIVSELASRACPRDDASFSQSRDFHFALNQGSLLTEPWTAVMIRVFAKAGVLLLESETMLPLDALADTEEDFKRADDCVRALWYLGRKSDMALAAAKILGNALKEKRKGLQEKVRDMASFLDAELWHGYENLEGALEVDPECES